MLVSTIASYTQLLGVHWCIRHTDVGVNRCIIHTAVWGPVVLVQLCCSNIGCRKKYISSDLQLDNYLFQAAFPSALCSALCTVQWYTVQWCSMHCAVVHSGLYSAALRRAAATHSNRRGNNFRAKGPGRCNLHVFSSGINLFCGLPSSICFEIMEKTFQIMRSWIFGRIIVLNNYNSV